jgi:hypothetical protein
VLNDGRSPGTGRYTVNRWGTTYLRAPHILHVIQGAYGDKLVRLEQVARVRRGITSGANGFFFLDADGIERWPIEGEFLYPAVKSPRQVDRVWLVPANDCGSHLFMCHRERDDLRGSIALEYIKYGESQGIHRRPTCRNRARWWDLGHRDGAHIHCSYLVDRVMRSFASDVAFLTSDNFQELHTEEDLESLMAACNSTLCQLSVNALGRSNFGGGLLKIQTYELKRLLLPDPGLLGPEVGPMIREAGLLDLDDPARQALDECVYDALGLTRSEREAVYEEVSRMVTLRLSKAQSLGSPV